MKNPAAKKVRIMAPPPPPPDNGTKIKVGKANVWRELGIPFAILAFAMMFCWGMSDIGTHIAKHPPHMDILKTMVTQRAEQKFERRGGSYAPNCQLFLAKSTLPGAGVSIFVGKDYTPGDTIALPGIEYLVKQQHGDDLVVPQSAFLLKHHHKLDNVQGTAVKETLDNTNTPSLELTVTKPIRAGDELFLSWTSHPQSRIVDSNALLLFNDIPGEEDFEKAQDIMTAMVARFRRKKGRENKGKQIGKNEKTDEPKN